MKSINLTTQVLAKLGFSNPLDYDIKSDGLLVILDCSGHKYKLPKRDYETLLEDQGTPEKPAPKPRGRKPKST